MTSLEMHHKKYMNCHLTAILHSCQNSKSWQNHGTVLQNYIFVLQRADSPQEGALSQKELLICLTGKMSLLEPVPKLSAAQQNKKKKADKHRVSE